MTTDPSAETDEYPARVSSCAEPLQQSLSADVKVDVAARSHQGNVRTNNEDFYLVCRNERALQTLLTNLPAGQVPDRFEERGYGMLVADGVGGMAAGEVASQTAISTLVNLVLNAPDWIMRIGEEDGERLLGRIAKRYRQVDAALSEQARLDEDLSGMSTTMTLAVSLSRDLFVGHVGDSRLYFRRGDALHQLTHDHTKAQLLADLGIIQEAEVRTHRLRHVLTRAVGGNQGRVMADVQRALLSDGDQLLLCTDGLTEMVDDATISTILREARGSAEACQALVEQALKNGGKDNVTVIVARYHFPQQS